jgi:hypothetical protein
MAKAKDDGLRRIEVQIGNRGGGGGSSISLMSPIDHGKRVNFRPSARAVAEMKGRGVSKVRAVWEVNAAGEPVWLEVRPAKPGEEGLRLRDNGNLRPHVHVPTAEVGTVVNAPSGTRVCPQETIDGDAFRFKVPDGLRFEKKEAQQ